MDYAAVFKKAQPFAYSYVDDDATSTFTCAGECGYRIRSAIHPDRPRAPDPPAGGSVG
ncbi:hypothetical protein Pth03_78730 [Planotetraspora thailandica]|uniref:Uncharacterized protein n=1 Tax=Planotetraspora thailandica TaxID=487172 RepID=A0A8J3Y2A9_9ACTN|nr:hypothetical protein Pth03_78730 [Planotetraspora thailandica]